MLLFHQRRRAELYVCMRFDIYETVAGHRFTSFGSLSLVSNYVAAERFAELRIYKALRFGVWVCCAGWLPLACLSK